MYFKDNASTVSVTHLVNGFVVIPLFILSLILLTHWHYRKSIDKEVNNKETATASTKVAEDIPASHEVFLRSYVCVPEGQHFNDIIDNSGDLTVLSTKYVDSNNLPILIKPIKDIEYYSEELYSHETNIDSITQRICLLIDHILIQNENVINQVANHFNLITTARSEENNQNLAISMHPEWQQPFFSETENSTEAISDPKQPSKQLSTLSIYLFIPDLSNTPYIKDYLTQKLIDCGIPEGIIDIQSPVIANQDNTESITDIIKTKALHVSQDTNPQLSVIIGADSQINDEWLEEHYFTSTSSSVVPEEAGTMLLIWNNATSTLFDIEDSIVASFTDIRTKNDTHSYPSDYENKSDIVDYKTSIRKISQFIEQKIILKNKDTDEDIVVSRNDKENHQSDEGFDLDSFKLTALSDISPFTEPDNLVIFMRLLDQLKDKGALVNEHHLGHYVLMNKWMQILISLSLFADVDINDDDEFNKNLLIIHDQVNTLLWITTTTDAV